MKQSQCNAVSVADAVFSQVQGRVQVESTVDSRRGEGGSRGRRERRKEFREAEEKEKQRRSSDWAAGASRLRNLGGDRNGETGRPDKLACSSSAALYLGPRKTVTAGGRSLRIDSDWGPQDPQDPRDPPLKAAGTTAGTFCALCARDAVPLCAARAGKRQQSNGCLGADLLPCARPCS